MWLPRPPDVDVVADQDRSITVAKRVRIAGRRKP
jgi:hypothetical protein